MNSVSDRSNSSIAEPPQGDLRSEQAALLYERFAKPLEPTHAGEFIAVTTDGRSVVGRSLLETIR